MLKRNLWKLVLSFLVVIWAVYSLNPLKDQPFPDYIKTHATAKQAEFVKLVDEASALKNAGTASSEFVALKQIGKERKIDLTQYFPDIELESSLRAIDKRNDILLTELLKRAKGRMQLGLDLRGGVAVTLEVDPTALASKTASEGERTQKLEKAVEIISQRINAYGVAEPLIRVVGTNRIEIQMPNLSTKDNPEILDAVRKPARLDFRLVHPTLTPRNVPAGEIPTGYEILTLDHESRAGETTQEELFVKRRPEMGGDAIEHAFARPDMYGKPEVILMFTNKGRKQFAATTGEIARMGRESGTLARLAIVLDGKLYSAPTVREEIDSTSAQISGSFTDREALGLANVLNNPLDLPLIVKEKSEVGPSLAQDAIDNGVQASLIATVAVCAFMVTYYTIGGLISILTLAVNLLIIFGIMAAIGATLTLPGLAGIVLTVGMAVDANILIYERMREEITAGKNMIAALHAGFDKAFLTIIDAHITQLAICAVMIWLGTGPIKGFGVTLAIGVFSTLFSVILTGRVIMNVLIESEWLKKFPMMHFFHSVKWDFVKLGKPAFIASWAVVAVGIAFTAARYDKIFGIDFTGGDQVTLAYVQKIDIAHVRSTAASVGVTDINPSYQTDLTSNKEVLKIEMPYGKTKTVVEALTKAYPEAKFDNRGESAIGPSIGKEIGVNAMLSLGLSLLAILLYIAFRFELGFALGAVVSTLHDVLMTIGMFVVFGGQFNAPMVAAILAIIGYSVNDTVVVFDRIREELKANPEGNLRDLVNLAIQRVFSRSLMTSVTVFLAAFALFIFGGGVLRELAGTFLIGIVTGTFSSICIAAQIFYWWHKGDRKRAEAHVDHAPVYEWETGSKD